MEHEIFKFMSKYVAIILIFLGVLPFCSTAQKSLQTFIFGHSLIHHEYQVNTTPSQETSMPHWMHFLAKEAGHHYAISGQYGFLPQHANLPPIAQWGFDVVDPVWDSDNESFAAAGFNSILITPGNFIQWQGPEENYPSESLSPLDATNTIFNWCIEQEAVLDFYIYENWPDMGALLSSGFPPSEAEWNNYNDYLNSDFHNWFLEYYEAIANNFPNACIRLIPVGPIISQLLQESPFNQIPITDLYEDDAPHGRPTTYFLASLVTYMSMYEEKAPPTDQADAFIHPIVTDNYESIVDFIWDKLMAFNDENGVNQVFCTPPMPNALDQLNTNDKLTIAPNPTKGQLRINGISDRHLMEIYSVDGKKCHASSSIIEDESIDLSSLPAGIYFLLGRNRQGDVLYRKKLVKL